MKVTERLHDSSFAAPTEAARRRSRERHLVKGAKPMPSNAAGADQGAVQRRVADPFKVVSLPGFYDSQLDAVHSFAGAVRMTPPGDPTAMAQTGPQTVTHSGRAAIGSAGGKRRSTAGERSRTWTGLHGPRAQA
jgi:hypothetical protein